MEDKERIILGKRTSNITLIVNVVLTLLKAGAGFLAGSTAIIADAFNSGTDIFATIVVFGGLRIAYLPPDERHHYGHAKAESVVSKIVAIIILITGFTVGYSGVRQIISRNYEVPGSLALIIASVSILIKFFLYKYTNKMGNLIGSPSLVADSFNHRSDILASSSVLAGIIGARFGLPILDPAAGVIVSIVIMKTGVSIYMEAIDALMDTAPDAKTMKRIKESVISTPGVITVNEVKGRKHGINYFIDLKICVDADITVEEGHNIASRAKQNIRNNIKNIEDIMIHVNPCHNEDKKQKPNCEHCHINLKDDYIIS